MSYRKNIPSILVVIIMSAILWIFIATGSKYTILQEIPIEVYNPLSDKILKKNIPTTASVRLNATGRSLIIAKYFKKGKLIVDINEIDTSGRILLNEYFRKYPHLVSLPKKNIKLIKIVYPNSIDIHLDKKYEKKIPLKLNSNIKLKPGYIFIKDIFLLTDSLTVFGAKSIIENIEVIETEELILKNVNNDIDETIELVNPKPKLLKFNKNMVTVKGNVDIIGEKTISGIEIIGKNIPEIFKVKFIPKTISIKVIGGNSQIQNLKLEEFKATFDYSSQWIPNKISYKPIITVPKNVIEYKELIPNKIEVVFEKKESINIGN
ncbi:MAG: CdaR family protein [Candidatus Marinimicrobia bacterium]|nr:CdaR family protein [Candidatus Neomarinimicrobiota bacterium]